MTNDAVKTARAAYWTARAKDAEVSKAWRRETDEWRKANPHAAPFSTPETPLRRELDAAMALVKQRKAELLEARRQARLQKRRADILSTIRPGITLRECPSYPGYFAGTDGHIYGAHGRMSEREQDGKMVTCAGNVHTLVADAFRLPKPEGARLIRHLNGDFKDNRPCNLRWGTDQENGLDRTRHRLRKYVGTGYVPPPPRWYTRQLAVLKGLNALHAARIKDAP